MSTSACTRILLSAGLLMLAAGSQAVTADSSDDQFTAHLNAGEFPAAQAMIGKMPASDRDRAISRLAASQFQAGARTGWATTLAGLSDSRLRAGSLSDTPIRSSESPSSNPSPQQQPRGGATAADFRSLTDLIKKTTGNPKPGWLDDGGVGTVEPFRGGVYVDPSGSIHKLTVNSNSNLREVRDVARASSGNRDVRRPSTLRKVSLTRLEREIQMRRALGERVEDSMRLLAGMNKVQYVLVYADSGEIVLAGPASDWQSDAEGRIVSLDNGRPVLQLDDFIVLLRNAYSRTETLGCSIDPRPENLERLQQFLSSQTSPLKPGEREKWVAKIRESAGKQDIRVFGLDPRTRVAQIMVEADYRMKLIGMGLEPGTEGVASYLASVKVDSKGQVPPMTVLRWWFTLNYDAVNASENHDAFHWQGDGVKVLSENQLLAAQGKRVATGQSEELNTKFAESFTTHFNELAAKYPIYAELQNVFDLALVCALIKAQDLPSQVGWQMDYFADPELCPVALGPAPREVDSVVNHRVINGKHVIAGVSGGVSADPRGLVIPSRIAVDSYGKLRAERSGSAPKVLHENAWWWD